MTQVQYTMVQYDTVQYGTVDTYDASMHWCNICICGWSSGDHLQKSVLMTVVNVCKLWKVDKSEVHAVMRDRAKKIRQK